MYSPKVNNGDNICTHQLYLMVKQYMYSPNVNNGKTTCTHQM